MKHVTGLLGLMFMTHIVIAQYYDSLSFVNANWDVQKIDRKVKLYQFHFNNKNLFNANENISYIKVKHGRANEFDIATEPQKLRTVSDFSKEKKAIAAINGNFFDVKNGGSVDFTKVGGVVINTNRTSKNEALGAHQKAAVVINNGILSIKKWDGLVNWSERLKESDVMLNGPLLLINKQNEHLDSNSFNITRHPRTCVGVTKKGHVIMLIVDGRNENSAGMNLFELTKMMRWLGCVSAINFDGGGSSTLWVKDQGVINYPTDNKKWNHEGERKVANVLYLKRKR